MLLAGASGDPNTGKPAQRFVNVSVPDLRQRIVVDAAGAAGSAEALTDGSGDDNLLDPIGSERRRSGQGQQC